MNEQLAAHENADSMSVDIPEDQVPAHASVEEEEDESTAQQANQVEESADSAEDGQTQQPDGSEWSDRDSYALKFRGRQIVPESRDQLVNWAQLGYNYDQRSKALTQREEELEQQREQYAMYQQMNDMFEKVPEFKEQVFNIYRDMVAGRKPASNPSGNGAAQGQQGNLDPQVLQYIRGLESKVNDFEQKFSKYESDQDIASVRAEIKDLRAAYPQEEWDAPDAETGKSLEREVVEYAHKHEFPSLKAAYRDMMWDSMQTRLKAQALKEAQENQRKNARAGKVGNGGRGQGSAGGEQPRVLNPKDISYEQAAKMALSAWK